MGKTRKDVTLMPPAETCSECGNPVLVMSFQKTGVCSENCRKLRDKEVAPARAAVNAAVTYPAVIKAKGGNPGGIR